MISSIEAESPASGVIVTEPVLVLTTAPVDGCLVVAADVVVTTL